MIANEDEDTIMPLQKGSSRDKRQYEHIEKSARKRGYSSKRAKQIAGATVNKKRRKEGRTKS
jgi:hypothetical protein